MRERDAAKRDGEVSHAREIGLRPLPRPMDLLKDHVVGWPMERAPLGHPTLERAQLPRCIAGRCSFTEQRKERVGLERRVALQGGLDPRPVVGEGVGAGAIRAWAAQRAGYGPSAQIVAGGRHAHAGTGSGLGERFAFVSFTDHQVYLSIGFHARLLLRRYRTCVRWSNK